MAEVVSENDSGEVNVEDAVSGGAITYLKMMRDASNSLGLTIVVDYMERYKNPFEMLSK